MDNRWIIDNRGTRVYIYKYIDNVDVYLHYDIYIYAINMWFLFLCTHVWGASFPGGSAGKESTCNVGDLGLIPGFGKSPGEGKGYPLQFSGLETSMDYTVLGVAKSQAWLSNFHFHRCMKGKAKELFLQKNWQSNNYSQSETLVVLLDAWSM